MINHRIFERQKPTGIGETCSTHVKVRRNPRCLDPHSGTAWCRVWVTLNVIKVQRERAHIPLPEEIFKCSIRPAIYSAKRLTERLSISLVPCQPGLMATLLTMAGTMATVPSIPSMSIVTTTTSPAAAVSTPPSPAPTPTTSPASVTGGMVGVSTLRPAPSPTAIIGHLKRCL